MAPARRGGTLPVSALAFVAACSRSAPPTETLAPPAPAPAASIAPPADHLAPGELIEGTQRAFGVLLPQVLRIHESFVKVVYTSGPTTVDALVPYFRAHLTGGELHVSPSLATFDHVHAVPEGAPGVAARETSGHELSVRIATAADGARVDIADTTPPVLPALPDDNARWKAVGLTPQGKVADPTHLD
jgi:hypothetical protein